MSRLRNKFLLGGILLLLTIGIPAVVFLSQQRQETRSRASASTTLYFNPATTASAPLQETIGQPVTFDVMISPGTNRPSHVKLEIIYDATKLQPASSPFVVNSNSFPVTQEGPILQSGKILISVNVGNDPSKAISQTTKVGTVNFTALAVTSPANTTISLGSASEILSTGAGDQATENVLSSTTPAYVMIANIPTATPIPTIAPPTATSSPTPIRKAGDGGNAGKGGGLCGSPGSSGSLGSNTTGGTGGTGGTGCSGVGTGNAGGIGGLGGVGSSTGPGNPGQNGANGTGTGAGGGGGGGGGGAPGQPGGRGGDGGTGCNGAPGQPGLPGEPAPDANTGGKGGRGGDGGSGCNPTPTPTNAPSTYSVSGYIYIDSNQNQIRDANEVGYANPGLRILASDGVNILYSVTGDSSGNYSFSNIPGGNYKIALNLAAGYQNTSFPFTLSANTTINIGVAPLPTPTTIPSATKLSLTVFMHGIGNSGDNANPTLFTLSNKNPLTPTRLVTVEVLNSSSVVVASANGNIVYDSVAGNFKGIIDMAYKITNGGTYKIKIKEKTHLRVLAPQDPTIVLGQTNTISQVTLIAGDVNDDNALNILDYNLLIGCYSDLAPAVSCTANNKPLTDLNDDGSVNQFDYNLFLREIAVQNGQ